MAEAPTGSNLPSPPPLVGATPTPLGPLPGSQPQEPVPDYRLPGVQPYFNTIFGSFVRNATVEQLEDDAWQERTIRQSMALAVKIIKRFPEFGKAVLMPAGAKIAGR